MIENRNGRLSRSMGTYVRVGVWVIEYESGCTSRSMGDMSIELVIEYGTGEWKDEWADGDLSIGVLTKEGV